MMPEGKRGKLKDVPSSLPGPGEAAPFGTGARKAQGARDLVNSDSVRCAIWYLTLELNVSPK